MARRGGIIIVLVLFALSSAACAKSTTTSSVASTSTAPTVVSTTTSALVSTTTAAPSTTLAAPAADGSLLIVSGDEKKVLSTDQLHGPCSIRTAANGAVLPDPGCTPGAVAARVTQDNIGSTICRTGYTTSVRPSASVTNPLKARSAQAYGLDYQPKVQEYDHLVPLELGGANDVRNLWVEPADSPSQTSTTNHKDSVENRLKDAVCAGRLGLADAQVRIARDWTTALAGL